MADSKYMWLEAMTDEEYKAFNDMVKQQAIDQDPKKFKKICYLLKNKREKEDIPVSYHLLRVLYGDPYVTLHVGLEKDPEHPGAVYGEKWQETVDGIFDRYKLPGFTFTSNLGEDYFVTLVFDRDECKKHGLDMRPLGLTHGEIGTAPGLFDFQLRALPVSEKEQRKIGQEICDWNDKVQEYYRKHPDRNPHIQHDSNDVER